MVFNRFNENMMVFVFLTLPNGKLYPFDTKLYPLETKLYPLETKLYPLEINCKPGTQEECATLQQ